MRRPLLSLTAFTALLLVVSCGGRPVQISGKDDTLPYRERVEQTFTTLFEAAGVRRVKCASNSDLFERACGEFVARDIQTARQDFTRKFDPAARKFMTPEGPWKESVGISRSYTTRIQGRRATVYVSFRNNLVKDSTSSTGVSGGGLVGVSIVPEE